MFVEELTWTEVAARVRLGTRSVIVPTGGTEQNGPHMVLGKHNFIIRAAAERIARELGETLVAPVVAHVPEGSVSPPSGHMRYPGAITLPEEHFMALLEYAARGFALHGFENMIFIGDSGGNQRGMESVAAKLNAEWEAAGDPARVLYVPEYYRGNGFREWLLEQGLDPEAIGRHAGVTDTSQLWYVRPRSDSTRGAGEGRRFRGQRGSGRPHPRLARLRRTRDRVQGRGDGAPRARAARRAPAPLTRFPPGRCR